MAKYTFGAELELADFDRKKRIPESLGVLDRNDITIVNTNGIAVNPYLDFGFGGEINTKICNSIEKLVETIIKIEEYIAPYTINYSNWLHIHIGCKELFENISLETLKKILPKIHKANQWIPFTNLTPTKIVKIVDQQKITDEFIEMSIRRNLTRTSKMTDEEYNNALNAETLDDFWKQFQRKRHLVNLQSLLHHKTIEFRFFYMSDKYNELYNAIEFCNDFVDYLFEDKPLFIKDNYPKAQQIYYLQEKSYVETKCEKRKKINNFTGEKW